MNSLNISLTKSSVHYSFEAIILRLGIMIGDETFSAGDLNITFKAEKLFAHDVLSIREKINDMATRIKTKGEDLGVTLEELNQISNSYNAFKNIKYKSPDQIKYLKALENMINNSYNSLINATIAGLEQSGVLQLGKLVGEKLIVNPTLTEFPETISEDDSEHYLMSEILLDRFDKETTDDVLLVPQTFGEYIEEQQLLMGTLGKEVYKHIKILKAENVFTLPFIVHLTAEELLMVREHLLSTNQEFRTNMTEWTTELLNMPFASGSLKTINERYTSSIAPTLKSLQAEMDKNERLRLLKSRTGEIYEYKVNLYVTSIGIYWDYLESRGIIKEETVEKLKEYPRYESLKNNSCIIFEGRLIDLKNVDAEDEEEEPLQKRKTLDL